MINEPTHFDIFSGIGGFAIAAEWAGFKTVAFAEIDEEANFVTREFWPDVPNIGDVRNINSSHGPIALLTGGVPCQPASLVGKRRGTSDERWMWPEAIRIVGDLRPGFAVFENPPALLTLESGRAINGIAAELSALGYDCWWDVIPACAIGAGHIRERLLLVAADSLCKCVRDFAGVSNRSQQPSEENGKNGISTIELCCETSNVHEQRRAKARQCLSQGESRANNFRRQSSPESLRAVVSCPEWWREDVTGIPVLVHGIPAGLAEAYHRCIGNAVVPQAVYPIIAAIRDQIA